MFPFEFNPTPPSPCTINLKIVQPPPKLGNVPEAGAVPTGALAAHTAGLVFVFGSVAQFRMRGATTVPNL